MAGTLANSLTINSGVTGTFDTQANAVTLSGIVGGSGSLTKIGTGTLTLTPAEGAPGTPGLGSTTVNAGTLPLSAACRAGQ